MLLGAIADDFTGASDLANTLAIAGMVTKQFVGVPAKVDAGDCEAGVVSLKTRSIPAKEAVEQSLRAADWLKAKGCEQILFKYCSTFDSTRDGNIGPVADALLDHFGAEIAVACPAFPATGRRLFMGHLFVGDRLLSESGMERHPLNPMTDPDLRRWLAHQSAAPVGHVPLHTIRAGARSIQNALEVERKAGARLIVTDAVDDSDLMALGLAIADHPLITGGSGIAKGLPENFRRAGRLSRQSIRPTTPQGPAIVLCGSCSTASQRQVQAHLEAHPGLSIDPSDILNGVITVNGVAEWFGLQESQAPIVYSTADASSVARAQAQFGRNTAASAIEAFFAALAVELAHRGVRRFVVGGGETSGAVVEALGIEEFFVGGQIDPGVPALFADRNGPLGIALKSGNFGAEDFFAKAIGRIGVE